MIEKTRELGRYSPKTTLLILGLSVVVFLVSCSLVGYVLAKYGFLSPYIAWARPDSTTYIMWLIGIFGIIAGLIGIASVVRSAILLMLNPKERKALWKHLCMHARVLSLTVIITISVTFLTLHTFGVTGTGARIEFRNIGRGWNCGHTNSAYYVIQDATEWAYIWNQLAKVLVPPPPPPEVNFSEITIIAVFMGECRSSGYWIEIKEVIDTGLSIVVKVEKTYPGWGCGTLGVITNPYHLIEIDKINKYVIFDTLIRIIYC